MPNYHLKLKGTVGGYDFDASYVDYILNKNTGKEVHVLIDSLGGSLATALSIVAAFREHGNVHVHYVGMNASAATIVSMGAKHVTMDNSAMYLVHKCSSEFFQWAALNADQLDTQIRQLEQMKTNLEKMDANVAQLYSAKCKKPTAQLLDLMKVGGWLTAQEAKDWGFVDEITNAQEDAAPVLTEATACAMAGAGIPLPHLPIAKEQSEVGKFFAMLMRFFAGQATETAAHHEPAAPAPKEPEQQAQAQEPQSNQNSDTMKHLFPLILAAIGVSENLYSVDENGAVIVSKEQAHIIGEALETHKAEVKATIEKYIAEAKENLEKLEAAQQEAAQLKAALESKNLEIQQLQARVDELGREPGDTTHQVHNNAGGEPEPKKTDVEAFFDTNYQARKLFQMLP